MLAQGMRECSGDRIEYASRPGTIRHKQEAAHMLDMFSRMAYSLMASTLDDGAGNLSKPLPLSPLLRALPLGSYGEGPC